MRDNNDIRQDVMDELRWDPRIVDAGVSVDVSNGIVTLSGSVDSYAQSREAAEDAERVWGVSGVVNHLDVVVPGFHARSDADIAAAAVDALKWNSEVPQDRITLRVANGVVTLDGTVDWYYQRTAAENTVRYLFGVRDVVDRIRIEPRARVSADDIKNRIIAALERNAEADAERIVVETGRDGSVTLRGVVHSCAERSHAERAAWAAPGVRAVDDQVVVDFE